MRQMLQMRQMRRIGRFGGFETATSSETLDPPRKDVRMLAYMKRTTVMLSDQLDARLRHEAERRGITISELTREAIEAHLGASPRRTFLSAGAGASGYTDTSRRIDEILAEGFGSSR